jgi:hypothetical protein
VRLEFVARSGRSDRPQRWLSGEDPNSSWAAEFDKFVSFVEGPLSTFLPWVLRAIEQLRDFEGPLVDDVDFAELAVLTEYGVSSRLAAQFIDASAPVDRRTANAAAAPCRPLSVVLASMATHSSRCILDCPTYEQPLARISTLATTAHRDSRFDGPRGSAMSRCSCSPRG